MMNYLDACINDITDREVVNMRISDSIYAPNAFIIASFKIS